MKIEQNKNSASVSLSPYDFVGDRRRRKLAVADRLRVLRELSGCTQRDVSQKVGINAVTLSGYEVGRNEPNSEALVRLADFYGVSVDFILCRF